MGNKDRIRIKRKWNKKKEKWHHELVDQLYYDHSLLNMNLGCIVFKEKEFNPIEWIKYEVDSNKRPAADLVIFEKKDEMNYRCLIIEVISSYEHEVNIGYNKASKKLAIYYNLGIDAMQLIGNNFSIAKDIQLPFYLEIEGYIAFRKLGEGVQIEKPYFWKKRKMAEIR